MREPRLPAGVYEVHADQPLTVDLHWPDGTVHEVHGVVYRVPELAGRMALRIQLRVIGGFTT